ncbi:hypothetical protein SAMN04487895_10318 [Paenibacillus sophorae]|uniref:DUF4375 domain-containing protein n=1 Tax=Paenibacillus sophorae TaxID=1333845 RepID=A0A1H8JGJ3_9BACL|nr:hypothetical protein [Paenibacillus sophorae]QWU13360.1 hypothetical protein KP014_15250 [Paenibacillus sophorae]SEN79924.1 hypothetical protein SAMN04487895_10318 [Paenibacillus sophorae]
MALAVMNKREFDSLEDERLGWACMEPTFSQIRAKDMSVKAKVISELSEGQRALCMFKVFYGHAKNSEMEYYGWISHLLQNPDMWTGVMNGLSFFSDMEMSRLLEETKEILETRNHRLGLEWKDAVITDLDHDKELNAEVERLYRQFQQISPESLKAIAAHIRANAGEFVRFEE